LSGAQLVNTDETLAIDGIFSGDVRERRRIEVRLRKSTPHYLSVDASAPVAPTRPRPRPKPPLPIVTRPYVTPPNMMTSH
jgi:hypothetical protein